MSPSLPDRVVVATHNAGKLREIRQLLSRLRIDGVSAAELGLREPEETGATFAQNASLKAQAAATAAGVPALADDSGLCVEALEGAPGIFSARWAGPNKDFHAAMEKIEAALRERDCFEPARRRASFVCVLAFAWPDGRIETFEGRVDGVLVWPARGAMGFGYDPIFLPEGEQRTFGEMSSEEKHGLPADGSPGLSHRARAFQKFIQAFDKR
ncbi:MAG TPA: RdgB/HAM1 family non-canonical purine NTP pyrophosphatase [Beijerinckiaceae bacterium]|nr:RdgB/HAM1 family non-canonical purine NTP pyrophosphatase [Beijerinckiaceae bacterium]